MGVVLSLMIVVSATAVVYNLSRFASRPLVSVSRLEYINTQSIYQVFLLGVALLVLLALYGVNKTNFFVFLSPGDIAAPAKGVAWLGISEGESWLGLGAGLTFFITLATVTVVYYQFRAPSGGLKNLWPFFHWVLLFSLGNSFSEEVIYRLGVVVPLVGTVDTSSILLISAVAFGLSHLRGMPNGIVGASMAGLLGWLLAKSVVETNGLFWAWFIHFLQDVVIFSALVCTAVYQSLNRTVGLLRSPSDQFR